MTIKVIIEGPSQSGKTQLANLIHNALIHAPNQRYDVSIEDAGEADGSDRADRCVNSSSHVADVNIFVRQTGDAPVKTSEDADLDTPDVEIESEDAQNADTAELPAVDDTAAEVVEDGTDAVDDLDPDDVEDEEAA